MAEVTSVRRLAVTEASEASTETACEDTEDKLVEREKRDEDIVACWIRDAAMFPERSLIRDVAEERARRAESMTKENDRSAKEERETSYARAEESAELAAAEVLMELKIELSDFDEGDVI